MNNEDLNKKKNSNINTLRYTLERKDGNDSLLGGKFYASNKEKEDDFAASIADFFGK